jgi:hypothetical protein
MRPADLANSLSNGRKKTDNIKPLVEKVSTFLDWWDSPT